MREKNTLQRSKAQLIRFSSALLLQKHKLTLGNATWPYLSVGSPYVRFLLPLGSTTQAFRLDDSNFLPYQLKPKESNYLERGEVEPMSSSSASNGSYLYTLASSRYGLS